MDNETPAGWYADPTDRNEHRYWDGADWTAHVSSGGRQSLDPLDQVVQSTVGQQQPPDIVDQPAADLPNLQPTVVDTSSSARRVSFTPVWAVIAVGVALLLGVVIGAAIGTDSGAKTLADERAEQISDLNRQIDQLEQRRIDARRALFRATSTTTASTTTSTMPPTTTTPPTTQPPPPPPPPTSPPTSPPPPTSTYYANCSAARAAGAAPVHRGDPGYGTHLDRDGDGIGCE